MAMIAGLRKVRVFEGVTEATLDRHGSYIYLEVTNAGGSEVKFYPNDFEEQGHPATAGIPIAPGTTRTVPMTVYNFKASGAVTVVAYGM